MESVMAAEPQEIPLGTLQIGSLPGSAEIPEVIQEVKKGETTIEGSNPAFDDSDLPDDLAPLTYVDFMPCCTGTGYIKGKLPEFAEFRTVVEQANQWLESMPQYVVSRCETIVKKLETSEFKLDNDVMLYHMSSHGNNVFLMGLRLWLIPKMNPDAPVQKLSYISVLPEHHSDNIQDLVSSLIATQTGFKVTALQLFQQYQSLPKMMEKLNRQLKLNPIQGSILNVETLKQLLTETAPTMQPELTCWVERGRTNRLFVYALRIFYVVGEPAFETLGIQDVSPEFLKDTQGINHKFKFSTYQATVQKASDWLKKQQGIDVLNIQTVDVKIDHYPNGAIDFDSTRSGHGEMSYEDICQFVKVLRVYYIKNPKSSSSDPTKPMTLTSRLFVPVRKNQTGKVFESFSKTMQRVIAWLNVTGATPQCMESVQYPVSPDSWGTGVTESKVESSKALSSGRYVLTCIRVYFPHDFEEPSPDRLPPTQEDEAGWMCVIS